MTFLTTLVLSLIFVTAAGASESEIVTIPLSELWALDMPGTRDINELFKDPYPDKPQLQTDKTWQRLVTRIRQTLARKRSDRKAMASFAVVAGEYGEEVGLASRGLGRGEPIFGDPSGMSSLRPYRDGNSFFSSNKLCIVFFSYASPYPVVLDRIERRGTVIDIRYRFVPGIPPGSTVHLAMIPLGKLPAGEYRVKISQSPREQKYVDAGLGRVSDEQVSRIICGPFSFQVWDPPKPDPGLSKGAVEIPLDQIWGSNIPGTRSIYELENTPLNENSLVGEIGEILSNRGPEKTDPGFVVYGTGLKGLKRAHDIIVKRKPRFDSLLGGSEMSIVFFTHISSHYVHLSRVEVHQNTIQVRYRLIPHLTHNMTKHFAFIPVGKLPKGEYQVDMVPEPLAQLSIEGGFQEVNVERRSRIVCSSFKFKVL